MIMKKCHLFQPTVNIFVNPGSSFPAKFPTCLFCAAGSVCRNRFQQREDPVDLPLCPLPGHTGIVGVS